ncbi:hypothetical protein PQU92_09460 [Asticcacaulis sp. BYS171W]|uniref:Uncharacterized protein n=1 Tax=Asticcacaulis aquaticus TaxID=2984212 RepID=A0ABT5HTV2_9CAUL|nr:hypothetical protein [Asticcacaulis aquaticus]MDC7683502.1 hypothetical protein [Asticcacaulis aquaticus]
MHITLNGRKYPLLKIGVPCWIGFFVILSLFWHITKLEARPEAPAPSSGYVVAETINRTTRYLSQTDVMLLWGHWALVFVYMAGVALWFWRLGVFSRRR